MPSSREIARQLVHILVGTIALSLRWLAWWQAAVLAVGAVLFNLFVLPHISRSVFRPGDLDAPLKSGIVIYPLAVLALVLAFPERLDIVAASWGVLAAGDGFATLIGAHARTPPLSWNRAKSTGGLIAFVVFGAAAAIGLALWTDADRSTPPIWWLIAAPAIAAIIAGFVETAPIRLNDNISVPATAAIVLWSLSGIDAATLHGSLPIVLSRLAPAAAVNFAAALLGWRAHTVTIPGAVAGFAIGFAIYLGTGWQGWTLLIVSFVCVAVATRAGFKRKALVGIAEERGGRRGPGNAIANTGIGAWAALIALGMAHAELPRLAMAAAGITAASDTIASEVGKAWGKTTWLVVGFRRVPPGTTGAVSLEGTLAGIISAAALAALAAALGLISTPMVAAVAMAATLASLAEGALGATLEGPGILDNNALNFVNSALGAGLALVLGSVW